MHTNGTDPDDHLPRLRHRIGQFGHLQYLRPAERGRDDPQHPSTIERVRGAAGVGRPARLTSLNGR
jgi:hypothetical protein